MTDNKLLLVNPPFPRKVAGVPLQLLYLAAAFRDTPVEVQILDLNIIDESSKVLDERLQAYKPTHVGITSYSPNYPESLDAMKEVKRISPSTITISGGPNEIAVGDLPQKPKFIDHRVTDTFGENALLGILGLERRIMDWQGLFPAYELLQEHPSYQFDSELFNARKMTQIFTATGCNQRCTFCSTQQEYLPFRSDAVIGQLRKIMDLGYGAVFFNDPNFTNPYREDGSLPIKGIPDRYGRVKYLMKALIEACIDQDMVWGCQTKASMVNPDLLDLMHEAGCRYITYALENVDRASLKEMHKGITPEIVQRAIAWTKERGIKTGLYVMFGTKPDREEDFEIARRTLDYVEDLLPNYLSTSILANYPMIDRSRPEQRRHMQLDYTYQRYSREPVWLFFDEGWGAFHPYCDAEQAAKYKQEIEGRMNAKPHIWGKIRMF